VVHGVSGLKVYAKVALSSSGARPGVAAHVHVGTGNYNATRIARMYTDLSLLIADKGLRR
jgi:polyphosphate kinase